MNRRTAIKALAGLPVIAVVPTLSAAVGRLEASAVPKRMGSGMPPALDWHFRPKMFSYTLVFCKTDAVYQIAIYDKDQFVRHPQGGVSGNTQVVQVMPGGGHKVVAEINEEGYVLGDTNEKITQLIRYDRDSKVSLEIRMLTPAEAQEKVNGFVAARF